MNHLLLYLLAEGLNRCLAGEKIGAIRLLRPLVVMPIGKHWLVVVLSNPGPFCFLADTDPLAGTGELVFKRIRGRRVQSARTPGDERVLQLALADSESGEELAIYPFAGTTRVRIEAGGTIIESLAVAETGMAMAKKRGAPRALDETMAGPFAAKPPIFLVGSGRRAVPAIDAGDDGPFADALAACSRVGLAMMGAAHAQIIERAAAIVRRHIDKRTRLKHQLHADLERANAFEAGRNEANILAAFQSRIRPGSTSAELPDLYHPERLVNIQLDPRLPIDVQIQKRYKRAAKLERGREVLESRLKSTSHELDNLASSLDGAIEAGDFASTYRAILAIIDQRGLRGRSKRSSSVSPERRLRRFELAPGWFAVVGRNDKENDEVTFKVARPDDIWLHAQQVAGSHVVVKSRGAAGNPPQSVLERAAGIAAHFSKAKHSKLVPIIYTKRKYVRKFRGAKPGQVVCEREKTIFAEPRLPGERSS